MASKFPFNNNSTDELDEYDQPTEPMRRITISSTSPVVPAEVASETSDETQVLPNRNRKPYVRPSSPQVPDAPLFQPSVPYQSQSGNGTYPDLPQTPMFPQSADAIIPAQPQHIVKRRSSIPVLVGMCLVGIQLLLLIRFILKTMSLLRNVPWLGFIYRVSDVFVLPLRPLFSAISVPVLINTHIYILLAVLLYGLFSRILVHILKVLMHSR